MVQVTNAPPRRHALLPQGTVEAGRRSDPITVGMANEDGLLRTFFDATSTPSPFRFVLRERRRDVDGRSCGLKTAVRERFAGLTLPRHRQPSNHADSLTVMAILGIAVSNSDTTHKPRSTRDRVSIASSSAVHSSI